MESRADAADPVQAQAVRVPIPKDVREDSSFSNFQECVVTHMALKLAVNFSREVLRGVLTLTVEIMSADVHELVLDTRDLLIRSVKLFSVSGGRPEARPLEFSLGPRHPLLGRALRIALPLTRSYNIRDKILVEVDYETSPGSACIATHWLRAEETAGKNHPYLFTHCAAIHCRSILPCQDAPAVKATYQADITVPTPLVALMSAPATGSEIGVETSTFCFSQGVPLSSFLFALAVGDFESREIGPRSRVWAEASFVEIGAYELSHTEECLSLAEEILGPYAWGRFDLLILPPEFPWVSRMLAVDSNSAFWIIVLFVKRGMANPCLTFVSPTLLAGDRSLVDVVAHEITHSWLGNLVSCSTWQDFWLSKAFTVFVERKIVERLYGKRYMALKAEAGWNELQDEIERLGEMDDRTKLRQTSEIDPDNFFSTVAAEKGCAFLWYLEDVVGGPAKFEPFLRAIMQRFQFGIVSLSSWKSFFLEYFKGNKRVGSIDWELWLDKPGMPNLQIIEVIQADRTLVVTAETVAEFWFNNGSAPQEAELGSVQQILFLQRLIYMQDRTVAVNSPNANGNASKPGLDIAALERLDQFYGFSNTKNAEILCLWCSLGIRLQSPAILRLCIRFLNEQGRMKFVRRVYRDIYRFIKPGGKQLAIETFKQAKSRYHAVTIKALERDLLQQLPTDAQPSATPQPNNR